MASVYNQYRKSLLGKRDINLMIYGHDFRFQKMLEECSEDLEDKYVFFLIKDSCIEGEHNILTACDKTFRVRKYFSMDYDGVILNHRINHYDVDLAMYCYVNHLPVIAIEQNLYNINKKIFEQVQKEDANVKTIAGSKLIVKDFNISIPYIDYYINTEIFKPQPDRKRQICIYGDFADVSTNLIKKTTRFMKTVIMGEINKILDYKDYIKNINESLFYGCFCRDEEQHISMFDAMSAGCIVIANNNVFTQYHIEHGQNGFIVNNELEFKHVIMNLTESQIAKISNNARQYVLDNFNSKESIKSLLSYFKYASYIQ